MKKSKKSPLDNFPLPACKMGYTRAQVESMMGVFIQKFDLWMNGQTMALCNGLEFDHEQRKYVPSGCQCANNSIYFPDDVNRFVMGLPVID